MFAVLNTDLPTAAAICHNPYAFVVPVQVAGVRVIDPAALSHPRH